MRNNYMRVLAMASAILMVPALSGPSVAQPQPRPGPGRGEAAQAVPVRGPAIRLRCCRCLDGQRQTVRIDTRAAPWRVQPPNMTTFQPVVAAANSAWTALAPGGWVGPQGQAAVGNYTYELRIVVPRCTIPSRIEVAGRFAADNHATVFHVSPSSATTQLAVSPAGDHGFLPASIRSFTAVLAVPGTHTLRVVVRNAGGPTGLIVEGAVTSICPRPDPEPQDGSDLVVEDQ